MLINTVIALLSVTIIRPGQCGRIQIVEEQPIGTEIISLSNYLKSLTTNQPTQYRLIKDNALSRTISVNSPIGNVTVENRIDREKLCQPDLIKCIVPLKFLVIPLYQTISIDAEIIDINDNSPSWPQKSITRDIIEFDGSKFEDRYIYVDKAIDPDAGENGSVSYSLTETDGLKENVDFKIRYSSPSNGRLILYPIRLIDRESVSSYDMMLLAKDNGTPRRTGSLRIMIVVIDKNDNSPVFERQQYRNDALSESAAIGSSVLTVTASDKDSDENGKISFRIDDRLASKYFEVDSKGRVIVKHTLDYDNGIKSFRFNVQAFDGAPEAYRKSGECEVLIHLKDENDEIPEILIHFTIKDPVTDQPMIRENQVARNFVLAHVQVRDPDYGGTDRVTCSMSENRKMILEVSSSGNNEYQIIATANFDREEQAQEKVEIICLDQARNKAVKNVIFQITDENDNSPIFKKDFHFSVRENSSNTILVVGDVKAEDRDEGRNSEITYSIDGESSFFRIDTTGRIFTKRTLDREEIGQFNLTILAKDGGSPQRTGTATVVIDVTDINDWRPEFQSPLYEFSITENCRIGSVVGSVVATDRDLPVNSVIKYRIIPNYTSKLPFTMSTTRPGEIVTTQLLDRELQSSYTFTMIADDNGRPISYTTTAIVKVMVSDVNDNTPIFVTQNHTKFSLQVSESVGYEVGLVSASDADTGVNGMVEYRIVAGNVNKYFDINVISGKLNLAYQIQRPRDMKVVFEACDKGVPRLCSRHLWVTVKATKSTVDVESGDVPYGSSQTDSRTYIFIIIILVMLLLIIIILVICVVLFKNRLCLPTMTGARGSESGEIREMEANTSKKCIDGRYYSNGRSDSLLIPNYPGMAPTGSMMIPSHTFDSPRPFRDRQISSDYQSIDGGSPPFKQGTTFNWDMVSEQNHIDERMEPLYSGHRSIKEYYYPAPTMPFHQSYSTYSVPRYRHQNYDICMTNIVKGRDIIDELPPRNSLEKRYSSLLNFDSVTVANMDNSNYKSLRKPLPKASFV